MNKPEVANLKLNLISVLNEIRYEKTLSEGDSLFDNYPDDIKSKYRKLREGIDTKKVNYKTITQEQKNFIEISLLAHYLWYIVNLQMKVDDIKKESYYVFSRMAESFVERRNKFVKGNSFDDWFRSRCDYYKDEEGKIVFRFKVPGEDGHKFTPRFMGRSVPPIYRFLSFLKDKDIFSIFLAEDSDAVLAEDNRTNKYLIKVFKDLDENSYFTKYKGKEGLFSVVSKEYEEFFYDKKSGAELFKKKPTSWKYKNRRYISKRLWTCLIDFFARGDGWTPLIEAVIGPDALAKLIEKKDGFEVPGDTHNDSKAFAECVWGSEALKGWERRTRKKTSTPDVSAPKIRSSRFVRQQYENEVKEYEKRCKGESCKQESKCKHIGWIPVDYDITFTYTQAKRMRCDEKEKTECTFCPIGNKFKYDDWNKRCHKEKGKECPYVKRALDRTHKCPGKDNCKILQFVNKIHPQQ